MNHPLDIKTPEAWSADFGVEILDPDGWRDGTRSWYAPITRDEFIERLMVSTIKVLDMDLFREAR